MAAVANTSMPGGIEHQFPDQVTILACGALLAQEKGSGGVFGQSDFEDARTASGHGAGHSVVFCGARSSAEIGDKGGEVAFTTADFEFGGEPIGCDLAVSA